MERGTTPDVMPSVYLHLENICNRVLLDVEKIRSYLISNGCTLTQDRARADKVLLVGCAFNNYTETESKKRLDEFLAEKAPAQDIFVLEGLADTMGQRLAKEGVLDKSRIIRTGRYGDLDPVFAKNQAFSETPEANFWGQYATGAGNATGTCCSHRKGVGTFDRYAVQVGHGCNDRCAFCGDKVVVKHIRSKPLEDCLREVQQGLALGYQHIDLIGDDVGAWGIDRDKCILDLLRPIVALEGEFQLWMEELNLKYLVRHRADWPALLETGRFRRMAVAFQSGNTRVLELMRRGYTREELLDVVALLRTYDIELHGHVIIGFPTETREEFEESFAVIEAGGFASVSFFLYQDRTNAPAHRIEPKVAEDEKLERLGIAEKHFRELGYGVTRRPDKLQILRTEAAHVPSPV
ncbi:MAG: radical SAM protein [Opitutales bacterium]